MALLSDTRATRVQTLFQRFLHILFRMWRGLTLGVRAVIRNENGEFLLVRHTYAPGWHFPGGGVEKGETVLQALSKEVEQETGLHVGGLPKLHGVFHNSHVSQNDHVLVYECSVDGEACFKNRSAEIAEMRYFGLSSLPDDADPGTVRRIREIVDKLRKSEVW